MPIREVCSNLQSPQSALGRSGRGGPTNYANEAAVESTISSQDRRGSGVFLLIPAYRPGPGLVALVQAFHAAERWDAIVIVDDGSGPDFTSLFAKASSLSGVQLVKNAVNLGKGAALKTGINFILCTYPQTIGIVTADADGQHDPCDVARVRDRFVENPDDLVLGVRGFDGNVPLRSKLGNRITKTVMAAVLGQRVADTQTGLRAVPRCLLEFLLKVPAAGYEFELEMLVAGKHLGIRVQQEPIRTIYEPHNPTSHFRPWHDSARIYSVLLRFGLLSVLTAVLDNSVFYWLIGATGSIALSQIGARAVAVLLNYSAARKTVFLSEERHRILLPKYLGVVLCNGLMSYFGIQWLTNIASFGVMPAKLVAEGLLFIANFLVQRDFVFSRRSAAASATDWDSYYKRVPFLARFTRRYTESVLIRTFRNLSFDSDSVVLELGGANSCFLDGIIKHFHPRSYHVLDLNPYGLQLLSERTSGRRDVVLHQGNVLDINGLDVGANFVFSVGLIEHFGPDDTRRAVESHFGCLREGGYALISFPTPTLLYRIARGTLETLGLWAFPDERPLSPAEVREAASQFGHVVLEKTLWPLLLTQHLMVVRKRIKRLEEP